jgi:MSHA biogenesis protein MshJ
MVFAGVFIVLLLVWRMAFFTPQTERFADLQSRIESTNARITQLEASRTALEAEIADAEHPDDALRETISALEADIERLTGGADDTPLEFIALTPVPEAIAQIEQAVNADDSLRIVRFDRQRGAGLTATGDDGAVALPVDHRRMRLVVEGDYAEIRALLARMESLTVPLVWRSLTYAVTEHPDAQATMRFALYAAQAVD